MTTEMLPTFEVDELLTKYELEPSIRDVYVEGNYDACLFQWLFTSLGLNHISVIDINHVNISSAMLGESFENSNRGRIFYMSDLFSNSMSINQCQAVLVADADLSFFIPETIKNNLLIMTDFTSIEMYFYDPIIMQKFFTLFCGKRQINATTFLDKASPVLQELFLFRLANKSLGLCLKKLRENKCINLEGDHIRFNTQEYAKRYLNANACVSKLNDFIRCTELFRQRMTADRRCNIHGHDFIDILIWFLNKKKINGSTLSKDSLPGALAACVTKDILLAHNLFHNICDRLRTA